MTDPNSPSPLYFERDLSWLRFNWRVLSLAERTDMPPLERMKFLSIAASNLNEFFIVRVAGIDGDGLDLQAPRASGQTLARVRSNLRRSVLRMDARMQSVLVDSLVPELARHGMVVELAEDRALSPQIEAEASLLFHHDILHRLTPTPLDPEWSYPGIPSTAIGIAALLQRRGVRRFAYVRVPRLPGRRFVDLGHGSRSFVPIDQIVLRYLDDVFPGWKVQQSVLFRVYRDADIDYEELDDEDQVRALEAELRARPHGRVVRLEVLGDGVPDVFWPAFRQLFRITRRHVYPVRAMIGLDGLMDLASARGFDELREPVWDPPEFTGLGDGSSAADVFSAIAERDVLVQHPYDDYETSVARLERAAVGDPNVLAVKHTLYRTDDHSPMVPALIAAQNRERRAVCLVEIKARFDELANIQWGRELERSGVDVSYGIPTLKTHTKAVLVVRREGDVVRRYAHIGTGNYHAQTARLYEDLGLFTADPDITADVADLFHWLTDRTPRPMFRRLLVAPDAMRGGLLERIDLTIDAARSGRHARIIFKMNSLVDRRCIDALYAASQAGVDVQLVIRGVCCLRPGVPGLSENIRVVSIVGHVLEHSRAYAFEVGAEREAWIGSADLMPRNLDRRVETLVPIDDPELQSRVIDLLERCMAERHAAWELSPGGWWVKLVPDESSPQDMHLELREASLLRARSMLLQE